MRTPAKTTPTAALSLTLLLLATCTHAPIDRSQGAALLFKLQPPPSASPAQQSRLISETIKVLQQRLDPAAQFHFQFTKRGPLTIEIWIPTTAQTTPEEVTRLATAPGILDFRITVDPAALAKDPAALAAVRQSLAQNGPTHPVTALGATLRWMQIAPQSRDNFKYGFVVQTVSGESYLLCYDDQTHTLTHEPPRLPWTVTAGAPVDTKSGPLLPFTLDAVGAKYMGQFTSNNLHQALAILFDNHALSAPTIAARIEADGEISFANNDSPEEARREANTLHQLMNAGPLPAPLTPIPPSSTAPS